MIAREENMHTTIFSHFLNHIVVTIIYVFSMRNSNVQADNDGKRYDITRKYNKLHYCSLSIPESIEGYRRKKLCIFACTCVYMHLSTYVWKICSCRIIQTWKPLFILAYKNYASLQVDNTVSKRMAYVTKIKLEHNM